MSAPAPDGRPQTPAEPRPGVIGIVGAGNIGSALARALTTAGHDVVIANSRGPETLADLVTEVGPRARAATAEEAAAAGEVVVVTVPLHAYPQVPVAPLRSKVVIDTGNYYPGRDGAVPDLDEGRTTTSELLQQHLVGARVVKAFNHVAAAEITTTGAAAGTPGRRALAVAGDDPAATAVVVDLLDEIGFDAVDLGPLAQSWRIERDTPGYGAVLDADGLRAALAAAPRTPGTPA